MKRLATTLRARFARRTETVRMGKSLDAVLYSIVSPTTLQRAKNDEPDRRKLLATIATHAGIRESALAEQVALSLGLTFLPRVLSAEVEAFPPGLTLRDFRHAGAVPITAHGITAGIVCIDPVAVSSLLGPSSTVPLYFGTWLSIARALDLTERGYLVEQSNRTSQVDLHLRKLAERIPALVVSETSRYGLQSCTIDMRSESVTYNFSLPDGRCGQGQIASGARPYLIQLLDRSLSESITVVAEKQTVDIAVTKRSDTLEYRLDWQTQVVSLPAVVAIEPVTATETPSVTVAISAASILIVEDNQLFSKVLDRYLRRFGYETLQTNNGTEALGRLSSGSALPAAIICDLHMPGMDGMQLLKELKSSPLWARIPVLVLTSDSDIEVELKLLELGADMFLAKNVDPRRLCAHVQKLVERGLTREAA